MKNLTILPPIALAYIQPVAKYMLHLPCISIKMAECPAGRAAVTLANNLETPSLQELRDFEQGLIEGKISGYATGYALLRSHCRKDKIKAGSLIVCG